MNDRKLSRRAFLRGTGLVGLGITAAACAPAQTPAAKPAAATAAPAVAKATTAPAAPAAVPPAAGRVTIKFAPWPGQPSRAPTQATVKAFNESQSRAVVVEEEMAGEGSVYDKLKVRAAANNLPDCAYMQGSNDYVSFVTAKLLLPIDELIAQDATFVRAERIPVLAEPVYKILGKTWGMPTDAAAMGMFYNKTLFNKAGVPLPKVGWTWDDFLSAAKALTQGDGPTKQWGYIQAWQLERTENWTMSNGAATFNGLQFPDKIQTSAPAYVEAMQFCKDLIWKHKVAPPQDQFSAATGGVGFETGKVAMCMEGCWRIPGWIPLLQKLNMEWDVAPMPKKVKSTTWMSTGVCPIFASTKVGKEAYEFIKFWNKEGQQFMLDLWARMDVTNSAAGKVAYKNWMDAQKIGPLAADAFWSQWAEGFFWSLSPAFPQITKEVTTPAWEEMFVTGTAEVAAKLKAVDAAAQPILDKIGKAPA